MYGDGQVEIAWCRGNRLRERTLLSTEQRAQLQTWAGTFAAYEYEQRDEAVADGMRVRLALAGKGSQTVSDADRQAMLDWASALVPPPAAVKPPATEVPVHNVGTVAETKVRYVLALKDVTIYDGPGTTYEPIGPVFDGQVAWVTGQSIDGTWWRVICPDDTVGDCWVSADPALTEPAMPLGAWPIYMLASGVSVEYPVDWSPSPGGYDGTQESVWFVSLDESTELLVFEGCWIDGVGGKPLTFFDTLQHFRSAFSGETANSKRAVNGMQVDVVHYRTAGDNGLIALDPGPGMAWSPTTSKTAAARSSRSILLPIAAKGPALPRSSFFRNFRSASFASAAPTAAGFALRETIPTWNATRFTGSGS